MRTFRFAVHRTLFAVVACCACIAGFGQAAPSVEQIKSLADAQHWDELARMLGAAEPRSAEMNFYYGMALARLGRFDAARHALEEGQRLAPADARFPVELAGVAFKQKKNARAEQLLRRALRIAPSDTYANDFLATLYFLDGNVEAALKYWNRVDKPRIAEVHVDPRPEVSAALLDRAFAFAPAGTLLLPQFLDTQARIAGLGIFTQYNLDLNARDDGQYDVTLRARERNAAGNGIWEGLFYLLRGVPFQQVSPSYYNLRGEAINFDSVVRWDAQKRRIAAEFSGPLRHNAKLRWEMTTDLRNENWAVRNGFTGPAPVLASFNMRTAVGGVDVASYASGRYGWRAGAEVSHRDFRSASPGSALTAEMLASGYELKQRAEISGSLWRVPERRFVLTGGATSDAARLWSANPEVFEELAGQLGWRWFPRARGDDYVTTQQLRAGKIFGSAPFDELFILGLERDNDLPMRAHIGTCDGLKGSAPLGSEYFLQNWELDKNLYGNGLVAVKLGPFVDFGRINDPGSELGSHKWLVDTGAQLKLSVLGSGLVFSYGKDLRTGNNAFYLKLLE
jgi:tetratricopeptide (TPR) repeat protein